VISGALLLSAFWLIGTALLGFVFAAFWGLRMGLSSYVTAKSKELARAMISPCEWVFCLSLFRNRERCIGAGFFLHFEHLCLLRGAYVWPASGRSAQLWKVCSPPAWVWWDKDSWTAVFNQYLIIVRKVQERCGTGVSPRYWHSTPGYTLKFWSTLCRLNVQNWKFILFSAQNCPAYF